MKIALRKIIWSDGSQGRYLIINNDKGTGRVKITLKQWKSLKLFGFKDDTVKSDTTEQRIYNILS